MLGEAEPFEGDDSRPRDQLREQVLAVLGGIPRSARSVAKAVGRRPDDSTVKRVLGDLHGEGLADKESAGWVRHRVTPLGDDALDAPPAPGLVEGSSSVTDALFVPNGDATCEDCGARLTGFGGRLVCVGCASGGAS